MKVPTTTPTSVPTSVPTTVPTKLPVSAPTNEPTYLTEPPTSVPTHTPTAAPTYFSLVPSAVPTTPPSPEPTSVPTTDPTWKTWQPSGVPSTVPTSVPTASPSGVPTTAPTSRPTGAPPIPPSPVPTPSPTAKCPAMAWLEGDMNGNMGVARGPPYNDPGGAFGDPAILNAEDIRAQGGLLVLDGNAQYKLSENKGYEGPDDDKDACCRFMQTTCPTPLPSSAPTSPPSPSPTLLPSETPTSVPTAEPSGTPTMMPTPRPTFTRYPSPRPTIPAPSPIPTSVPTPWPTTASPSAIPIPAPTPGPTPAPTSCRCVAYYGVNRNVGNFAFRDDGLVYGSLPAVNPASEHYDLAWAAGATLKDGFNWDDYLAAREHFSTIATKQQGAASFAAKNDYAALGPGAAGKNGVIANDGNMTAAVNALQTGGSTPPKS